MSTYTSDNKCEIPNQTPVELPIGYKAPETLDAMIRRLITNQQFQQAQSQADNETFEESDDFEVGDDIDLKSEHQFTDMEEELLYAKPSATQRPPMEPETKSEIEPSRKAPTKTPKTVAKSHTVDIEEEIA